METTRKVVTSRSLSSTGLPLPARIVVWIPPVNAISWLANNWVNLLQGIGIVGSLLFTGKALHQSAASMRLNAMLKLGEHHRDIWSEVHRRPELTRVLQETIDLISHPVTPAEEEFLNIILVHFQTGWEMTLNHGIGSLEAYRRDLLEFLSLPIPTHVWENTKQHRDPRFVEYVEQLLPNPVDSSADDS
jgi:hypothetical protein